MTSQMRVWLVAGLMMLAAAMAVVARPTVRVADGGPKVNLEVGFPKKFGDWSIDERVPVVLPSPDVQATIERIYSQVLSRTYVNSRGERVMLSIAYGGDQTDGMQVHRPEVCYPAQGFQVLSVQRDQMELLGRNLPVRKVLTRMGGRTEPVLYWIVVGDKVANNDTQWKLMQLTYGLRGRIPDGMLVRVSSLDTDTTRAYDIQTAFLRDAAAAMSPEYQSRLFGAAGQQQQP
ncbi:exosortase-associated protein EpsI, B-type [Caldimonas brevitalea]|uniref:Methanolan biosynthesis EpsI domain-containing protein n=1 Tax=Caldimonas brevitalea TaxID=413882 RepID=A0A0G3BKM3_9BURK|nr:exosortase-associated protein EpsI, B-type [Caldimonas brevitalea]AKJ27911.1 hypothetical protein AAW51_1220 [Caldimonas brevitalea]